MNIINNLKYRAKARTKLMKKILSILICVILGVNLTYAATATAKVDAYAQPSSFGSVYVSKTKVNAADISGWVSSSIGNTATGESGWFSHGNAYLYSYAKANSGYTFAGWSESVDGPIINTDNPKTTHAKTIQIVVYIDNNVEETLYAQFKPIITVPQNSQNVTLSKKGSQDVSEQVNVNLYNASDFRIASIERTAGNGSALVKCETTSINGTGPETPTLTISTQSGVVSGDKFKITLKATNDAVGYIYVEVQAEVQVLFAKPTEGEGSYTATRADGSGVAYTLSHTSETDSPVKMASASECTYNVVATAADGYQFRRWVVQNASGEHYYYGEDCQYKANNGERFTAEFIKKGYAQFIVLGTDTAKYKYAHLDDAIDAAQTQGKSVVSVYVPGRLKVTSKTTVSESLGGLIKNYNLTISSIEPDRETEWVLPKPKSGTYTIPAGITFLVPGLDRECIKELIDNKTVRSNYVSYHTIKYKYNTGAASEDDFIESNPVKCICKLNVESGTRIEVNGGISVYSAPTTTMGYTGRPTGYGHLHLERNSTIQVNEGGKLHVLGYVTGADLNSTVTAKNGATIYESFQFTDWRGGTAMSTGGLINNEPEAFPVGQYYIQSIETKLILEYGAQEYLIAAVDVMTPFPVCPVFINSINEQKKPSGAIKENNLGLFLLGEGTRLEKYYDFTKDSLCVRIIGDVPTARAKINYIYLDVNYNEAISLDSRKYVMPINHNIALTIDKVLLECPYKFAFMPGSRLEVSPTAHLKIQNKVYLYDAELNVRPSNPAKGFYGSNSVPLMPITYTSKGKPTARSAEANRYPTKMKDARFVIDGTLTMEDAKIVVNDSEVDIQGMLHTTNYSSDIQGITDASEETIARLFGANITSTANGVINFNRLGSTTPVYQIKQTGTDVEGYEPIPVCNAWLRNSDGTREGGENAGEGDTYMYINGFWVEPTATLSNPQGANFVVTLPNPITQNVICDEVVGNGATITNVAVSSVEGTLFEVGTPERKDGKVTIPVTYNPNGVHNADGTPNQGKIILSVTYTDVINESHSATVDINLTGVENYQPAFSVTINGTPMQNGDTYPTIQGTGVGETDSLSVVITPDPNNITSTNLVDWIDAESVTSEPFSFNYGDEETTKLSGALLVYSPSTVSDNDQGVLTITATYPNEGKPIESSIIINLSAKVGYKPNTLEFAQFPIPVYETTEPFLLLNEEKNNAGTPIEWSLSSNNVVNIIGDGITEPYKVDPIGTGWVDIVVKQKESASVNKTEINTRINVKSVNELLPVPFCIEDNVRFNSHTIEANSVVYNTTNNTIEFNSVNSASSWQIHFLGVPDKLTFTPNGNNTWRIREKASVDAAWTSVMEWATLVKDKEVSLTLKPTTQYVEITYGAAEFASTGTIKNVCVSDLTLQAREEKIYMPIYHLSGAISEKTVVFAHVNQDIDLTIAEGLTILNETTELKGVEGASYYETTVTIQANSTTEEGIYTLEAKHDTATSTVSIRTYKFPQELPIRLTEDIPERYNFVTKDYSYAQWNEEERRIILLNPGAQLVRSVTFAFNGAPSVITFDSSEDIVDSDWTIYESVDGVTFSPSSLEKRDSLPGKTLKQLLDYTTRYVKIEYNSDQTHEVSIANLVIEGYPQAIINPTNLFFTKTEEPQQLYMIAINLQEVDFEIDNDDKFQMTLDATDENSWTDIIHTSNSTHPSALGVNMVDTIFLWVKWSQKTALDEGKITIKSKTNDSILTIIPLVGSDNYLTIDKAENTGLSTGIPNDYTYHGKEYTAYEHREVKLTNTFADDGTALFDYLFIYGETTPPEGETNITPPGAGDSDENTNVGSNAVTPLYVYQKTLNAESQYKGYQFVGKIDNVNDSTKMTIGDIIVRDDSATVYVDARNKDLRVYMTGFSPYATTGYTKQQEGVFLFRGNHGDTLDIYLENFYVSSRNKTKKGNKFYGNKEGGKTYSEKYSRGSGGVLVFENMDAQEELDNFDPFEVSIHIMGDDNLLNSNHGCFYALKIGKAEAMRAYQVSSPIQVHMHADGYERKTKTTLNFDDVWPTAVDADNVMTDSIRTNGFLALKKQANNAPSIDLGNPYTIVNFKGGRIELQNSQIGSDTYKTTLAISYRAGFFGSEEAGIQLCHGIGTDAVDGTVNFLDGTVTVERMKVSDAYRQYYLMDTLPNGTESEYTTCLRTPKNTFVRGGSICRVRACQHVTSKGGAPKDTKTGSLLGQYVYRMQPTDELNSNGSIKSIAFPGNLDGLQEYQSSRNYTYGLASVTPDAENQLYFWVPEGYGGVTTEKDVYLATWKACMTKITAGIPNVATGTIGGDIDINAEEEVKYFLYCQIDDNIHNVISGAGGEIYKAPIEVPSAAREFFNGDYTRWAPNEIGEATQHQVLSDVNYTITDRVYYITTITADLWKTFTAPFDVANIYVVESFSEAELEDVGTRSEILKEQAKHNADFAAFFGVAMAMGTDKSFDGIYQSYIKWAKAQDRDSLGIWDGDGDYTLRGMQKLTPYFGNNWRDANFYLNENRGNWTLTDEDEFNVNWRLLSKNDTTDGILLHKGFTYSMMFPYCTGCDETIEEREDWDYWSGKFLIFESVSAPQTINGKDFLNEEIENNIFTVECASDEVAVTGNSTFAMLETDRSNLFVYDEGEGFYNAECFLPKENDNDIVTIQPTTAFLYGKVPVHPISGMPAKKVTRDGKIIYGEKPNQDDNTQDNPEDNSTTGGNVPTVGGGNNLFITAINGGINIAVATPQYVRVLTATGAIIFNGYITTAADVNLPTQGIYVISGENEVQKIFY